jgi:hypothetical protein
VSSDRPTLFQEPLDDSQQQDGTTSIRFGAAILQPEEEKGHYGLYRPLVIVRKDGEKVTRERLEKPVGPLAIYRTRRSGDKIPADIGSLPGMIRTSDPRGNPMEVILVWRPDTGKATI